MPQLNTVEQNLVDQMVRKDGQRPIEALRAINKAREKANVTPLDHKAVYQYVKGVTQDPCSLSTPQSQNFHSEFWTHPRS